MSDPTTDEPDPEMADAIRLLMASTGCAEEYEQCERAMSDNVVEFPERRESIPVNLPDIPNLERAMGCVSCGNSSFKLVGTDEIGLSGVICSKCGDRARLENPCFLNPIHPDPV